MACRGCQNKCCQDLKEPCQLGLMQSVAGMDISSAISLYLKRHG
jgi:hypothetical protein